MPQVSVIRSKEVQQNCFCGLFLSEIDKAHLLCFEVGNRIVPERSRRNMLSCRPHPLLLETCFPIRSFPLFSFSGFSMPLAQLPSTVLEFPRKSLVTFWARTY